MDAVSVASMMSAMQQAKLQDQVGTAVMRKALDVQESTAQALLSALPQVPQQAPVSASNTPHLGNSVNVFA